MKKVLILALLISFSTGSMVSHARAETVQDKEIANGKIRFINRSVLEQKKLCFLDLSDQGEYGKDGASYVSFDVRCFEERDDARSTGEVGLQVYSKLGLDVYFSGHSDQYNRKQVFPTIIRQMHAFGFHVLGQTGWDGLAGETKWHLEPGLDYYVKNGAILFLKDIGHPPYWINVVKP